MLKAYKTCICGCLSLLLFSCTETKQEDFLKLDIRNASYEKVLLYSYLGDNQIFVDTIAKTEHGFKYSLSTTCNAGVYRLVFPTNESLDFIYNKESVVIQSDAAFLLDSIKFIESKENKVFYEYISSINQIHISTAQTQKAILSLDSTLAKAKAQELNASTFKKVQELHSAIYADNAIQNLFAIEIIRLLDMPIYELFVAAYPDSIITKPQYLLSNCFSQQDFSDPRLLATPYLYVALNSYLSEFAANDTLEIQSAISKLYKRTTNNHVQSFFKSFLYEYVYQTNNYFLQKSTIDLLYKNNVCANSISNPQQASPIVYSQELAPLIPNVVFNKADVTFLVFSNDSCALDIDLKDLQKELQKQNIAIQSITPEYVEDWNEYTSQYNVLCTPALVVVNKSGYMQSRSFGTADIQKVFSQFTPNKD